MQSEQPPDSTSVDPCRIGLWSGLFGAGLRLFCCLTGRRRLSSLILLLDGDLNAELSCVFRPVFMRSRFKHWTLLDSGRGQDFVHGYQFLANERFFLVVCLLIRTEKLRIAPVEFTWAQVVELKLRDLIIRILFTRSQSAYRSHTFAYI